MAKRNFCMLVLVNTDKNNISKLISILRRHPNKAMSPELAADGILILMKYADDTDLQNIIRHIKDSVHETIISVPFYYTAFFPTHVNETIVNAIKFFFLLYTVSILTYLGASVKSATDSHVQIQYATIIVYALVTGLFPAATAVLIREKEALNRPSNRDPE